MKPKEIAVVGDDHAAFREAAGHVGLIGRGPQPLPRAGHAHEFLGLVVIGRHLVVGHRPVRTQAVKRIRLEIVIGEAQRDSPVVIGAATHDARPPPFELRTLRHGVRLAVERPISRGRRKVSKPPRRFSEIRLGMRPGPAMVHLVRPHMLLEIFHGIQHRPRFKQRDVDAEIGEHFCHRPAARARPNHHHVVHLGTTLNLEHDFRLYHPRSG